MISLRVPADFAYRDLVTRAVATACKIAVGESAAGKIGSKAGGDELTNAMVSAIGEAFNNVVEHAYGTQGGDVELEIISDDDTMRVTLRDSGETFDIDAVADPDLEALPESGMGLYIIRSFVDELSYTPGPPNTLVMLKRLG